MYSKKYLYFQLLIAVFVGFVTKAAFNEFADTVAVSEFAGSERHMMYMANLNRNFWLVTLIAVLVWGAISTAIYLFKDNMKQHQMFAVLYLSIGLLFLGLVPVPGVPDEPHHFLRAFEISRGGLISDMDEFGEVGGFLPENLDANMPDSSITYRDLRENFGEKISDNEIHLEYENTALYSPLSYLPQALGVLLGRVITKNVLLTAYFGRFFAFLTIGFVLYLSIKNIPVGKNVLMAVSLLPITVQECMSLAADGMAYAMATALFSYVMYLRYGKIEKIGKKQFILLSILCIMVASCKVVYLPVCLCVFLLPLNKIGDGKTKNYIISTFALCALAGVFSLGWLAICHGFLPFGEAVNSGEQLSGMLKHPINYLLVLYRTFGKYFIIQMIYLFGGCMGMMDIACDYVIVTACAGIFFYIVKNESVSVKDENWKKIRIALFVIVAILIVLTLTSLYLQYTPVGLGYITGMQGRYYIPMILLFVLALKKDGEEEVALSIYPWMSLSAICIAALVTMVARYLF